ncbi:MAG: signal peptidase I [Bacilli bacterium]|nr:signal peptidase I [Bacilli bacterium]
MGKNKKGETYRSFRGIIKFFGDVISWTVFILLLLIAIALLYYVFANYRYSKKGRGYEPLFSLYTIISPSMEPNIKVYDVIIDVPVKDYRSLKVGEVITFKSESSISKGMTVTHRITNIKKVGNKYYFTTKGDSNETEDTSLVVQDNVIGKVKLRIPQLGRIQYFLASRGGWLLVILIPAVFILITDVIKLIRMLKINKQVNEVEEASNNKEIKFGNNKRKKELQAKLLKIDLDDEIMELPKLKQ